MEYDGPALQCRNITSDEYHFNPHSYTDDFLSHEPSPLYMANVTTELYGNYDITTNYARAHMSADQSLGPQWTVDPGGGVYCELRNATYIATFNFANNTKQVSASIQSYGKSDVVDDLESLAYSWNTWGIFNEFAAIFNGTYNPFSSYGGSYTSQFITDLFNVDVDLDTPPGTPAFSLAVANLSEHMTGIFTNLMLGIIPYRLTETTVPAFVETGISVWTYTPWKLWAVYGSTFLL